MHGSMKSELSKIPHSYCSAKQLNDTSNAAICKARLRLNLQGVLRLRVIVNSIVIESLDLTSLRLRVIVNSIVVFSSRPHEPSATCDRQLHRHRIPRPHEPSATCDRHRLLKWPSSSNPSTSSGHRHRIPRPHEPSATCDRHRIPRPHEPSATCDRHRLLKWPSSSQVDLTSLRLRVIVVVFSSGDRRRIPRPHEPSAACGPHRAFGSSGDRQRIPRPHEPSAQVVIVIESHEPLAPSGERHRQHQG